MRLHQEERIVGDPGSRVKVEQGPGLATPDRDRWLPQINETDVVLLRTHADSGDAWQATRSGVGRSLPPWGVVGASHVKRALARCFSDLALLATGLACISVLRGFQTFGHDLGLGAQERSVPSAREIVSYQRRLTDYLMNEPTRGYNG
jgi:hypothetical protein